MSRAVVTCFVFAGMLASSRAHGQSLADVARQEEERRRSVPAGKVYTNDSVKPEPTPVQPATPAPASAQTEAKPADGKAASTAAQKPASAAEPAKDEAYWKKRLSTARDNLQRALTFAEALQSRINALSTDFVNRDDPAQRSQVAADRQKALDEQARVKKEITQYEKEIGDIQEEGRRAGAPAGWLR